MTENSGALKDSISFNLLGPFPFAGCNLWAIRSRQGRSCKTASSNAIRSFILLSRPLHVLPARANNTVWIISFVSKEAFEQMIDQNELMEYANVYDQYKGVPKSQVREAMHSGQDVIMRLDVQGAKKIRSLCQDATLIFLAPTNIDEWVQAFRESQNRDSREPASSFRNRQRRIGIFIRIRLYCL